MKQKILVQIAVIIFLSVILGCAQSQTENASDPTNYPTMSAPGVAEKPLKRCPPEQTQNFPINGSYIGLIHSSTPEYLQAGSSVMISIDLGISHVSSEKNNFIWLEELLCHDSDGHAYWKVVDEIVLPQLDENEIVSMATCAYKENGEIVDTYVGIVVVGYFIENNSYIQATQAWASNIERKLFEKILAENVSCFNDCVEC